MVYQNLIAYHAKKWNCYIKNKTISCLSNLYSQYSQFFHYFYYLVWPTWSNVCLQTNQRQELAERLWCVTLERPGSIPRRSNLSLVIGFRRESLLPRFPLGLIRWSYTRPLRLHVLPNMINKRIGFEHRRHRREDDVLQKESSAKERFCTDQR